MAVPRFAWAILLCVAVDFSNPMLPGTVRLNPSESIEAVHGGGGPPGTSGQALGRRPSHRAAAQRPWIMPSASRSRPAAKRREFLVVRAVRHQPGEPLAPGSVEDD
jgi:hypothetical protein